MKSTISSPFKKSHIALLWCTAALVGGAAYADTKVADTSANFGTTTDARKPDAVLEVVGGTDTKPSFLVRKLTDNTASGVAGSGASSMIVTTEGMVGIGTNAPAGALDVTSTTGGFLPPRMTLAQANAMTKVAGTIAYITDNNGLNEWTGSAWRNLYNGNVSSAAFAQGGLNQATGDQAVTAVGQPLIYKLTNFNSGTDITINNTTGVITLKPGTYVVTANTSCLGSGGTGTGAWYIGYNLFNRTANAYVYTGTHNDCLSTKDNFGNSSSASWTFTVPSVSDYDIRAFYYSNNVGGTVSYRFNSGISISRIF